MPLSRAMRDHERKMNFQQLDDHLNGSVIFWRRKLSLDLFQSRELIIKGIRTGSYTIRTEHLPRLMMIRNTISRILMSANEDGRKKMRSIVRKSRPKKVRKFQEAFAPKHAIRVLRDKAFFVSQALDSSLVNDTRNAMIESLRNGEGILETTNKVVNIFAPYVGDSRVLEDGKPVTPHRAETIVRTNYTEAFNLGILNQSVEVDPRGEFIQGFEFSAILDTRTTEVCTHLDGRIFRPDDPNLLKLQPPRHFNCRSVLVPIFIDEEIESDTIISPSVAMRGLELSGDGFGRPTVRNTPSVGSVAPVD